MASTRTNKEKNAGLKAKRMAQLHVVAIGASAGGLEAIHEFFDHLPTTENLAFIIIQHLSPNYKSLLVELVAKHTQMNVYEAREDELIEENCVYVIPNNKMITVEEGKIKLAEKDQGKLPNTAIDTFMHALASDFMERSVAIILSGTGTDGTKGAKTVKENGGLVMVQDPDNAKFDGMPQSAIAAGLADVIATPKEMPDILLKYLRDTPANILANGKIDKAHMDELLKLVHKNSGFDFSQYKMATLTRRVLKHMAHEKIHHAEDYVNMMRVNPDKLTYISYDFLINFTQFFRDTAAFSVLEKTVLPGIIKDKPEGSVIKIWICAVSTGEEAYTTAIVVDRYLQKINRKYDVKIFATDINNYNVEKASKNIFPQTIKKNIPADVLDEYFVEGANSYLVIPRIRKMLVFARQNILTDPPFIKNDFVLCRNMLIYMGTTLQQKVLSALHFSLNKGGYLFLGASETAGFIKNGVEEISNKWKIYRKTVDINFSREVSKDEPLLKKPASPDKVKLQVQSGNAALSLADDFTKALINDLGFTGYYIDSKAEIKQTLGDFNQFLKLPQKQLNLNIVKMVPSEVGVPLNMAIRKCFKEKKPIVMKPVMFRHNKKSIVLNVVVKPAATLGYLFILIGENRADALLHTHKNSSSKSAVQELDYVSDLENELTESRTRVQTLSEEMETSNEELQSSNEELLSSNEELQSSNEELQSLNEELHTLNTEHQIKIKELIDLNDDLNNYFRSTDIGQVFLDNRLQIRKFNPASVKLINLIESDIGRPIDHISNNFKDTGLMDDIAVVVKEQSVIEKEVQLRNGKTSLMRIMPYIRSDKKSDGVVITFVDISALTQLTNLLKAVLNSSLNGIMAFKAVRKTNNDIARFECIIANKVAEDIFNEGKDLKGADARKDIPQLYDTGFFKNFSSIVDQNENLRSEFEIGEGKNRRYFDLMGLKMGDGLVITFIDNTDKRLSENRMRKNYNELIIARENLKKLNNDLEKKVLSRTTELSDSQERFELIATATNDALWDWDILQDNLWWNPAFYKQMGYENSGKVKSRKFWLENVHEDDRKQAVYAINQATSGTDETWQIEYRFKKADNTFANILDRGYILRDEYGTPYRMLGSMFDTSEIRRAIQIAKSSQNKFKKIFDSQMIGMILFNYDGLIVEANQSFLNMLGYSRQDILQKKLKWNEITPSAYQKITTDSINKLKTKGESSAFEKQFISKNGSRVDVLVGSAALNEDAEANAVAYIIDISDQKKADRKQRELESRFSFLADFMPAKIWTSNSAGGAEYFNQRWVEYTDLDIKEMFGWGWVNILHPDDRERTEEIWKKSVFTGSEYEIEYRLRNKKNLYRWHLSRALPYKNKEGEITMWMGTSTDIHDQKTFTEALRVSGNNFRQLSDQTPFMIWRVDENGLCTYVNKPWIDFTGISFEESLDIGWSQAVHPDEKEVAYKEFMQVFTKHEIYKSKLRIRRKDGQYRWVLAQSNPVFDKDFQGYIGSFTDITEQQLAQEATKLLMMKKDEFMSIASHELKTPITTMKASLQIAQRLIDKQADVENIRSFVFKANNQINKLSVLVGDLLDVTKIQAGKMQLSPDLFMIKDAIEDSLEQVQNDLDSHKITVGGDLETMIFADKNRLEQVITNFLSNAIKYSPDADTVIVDVKSTSSELKLSVQDFGIGIPGNRANFVFDRFFRVQESSQKFSGLGLGLYISAEIIQRHGGEVGVDSKEGEGSVFWFKMPLNNRQLKDEGKLAQNLQKSRSVTLS